MDSQAWIPVLMLLAAPDSAAANTPDSSHLPTPAVVLAAHDTLRLRQGARVRVLSPRLGPKPLVGSVANIAGDTLTFLLDDKTSIPMRTLLDSATTVEMSVKHHNRLGRGISWGASAGFVAGAIIVGAEAAQKDAEDQLAEMFGGQSQADEVSSAPIFIGAAIGAVVGGLIGSMIQVDKWVRVPTPVKVSLGGPFDPDRGLRVAVSVPLRR